jgi:hypothetical protein
MTSDLPSSCAPQEVEPTHLHWIKASASIGNGACVELAKVGDGRIALRDSKNPQTPPLLYTHAEIAAFLDGAKKLEFDHLLKP